jgi:glutaredoxin
MKKHDTIKMYGLTTCFHCKSVVSFLEDMQVSVEVVNVDEKLGAERREILKDVKLLNQRCTFPTTVIGEQVVVGYKEDQLREALGL